MKQDHDILVVGAGHAAAQLAIALRQQKFEGTIAIVGEEPELPYERPPLSKEYLAGDKTFERILIRPPGFWVDRTIDVLTGRRVIAVDPEAHAVTCDDGETLRYRTLVWAAGGHARRLTCRGGDLTGVHSVRTRADVDRLLGELDNASDIVVVGGGYIGLEAAAALSKLGKRITVVEALDRVLARVASEPLSRFFEAEHRAHGVDVRLSTAVTCIEGDCQVTGVRLASGEVLPAQIVIVGIGIVPAVEPLIAAGAAGSNGVDVDRQCRTSLADVYAIGDCAAQENAFADMARIRVESVANANDQATLVAKAVVGRAEDIHAVPWFWSNQYDLKLQTVGLSVGHDTAIVRGDPGARSFSVIYGRNGRVVALDCVNATRDYVQGRGLVVGATPFDAVRLADTSIPLKNLLA